MRILALLLLLCCCAAVARDKGKAKGQGPAKHRVHAQRVEYYEFRPEHRTIIVDYYRRLPRHGDLPPGIEKQLRRKGHLPPGLEKKLVAFPPVLVERLPPCPYGYQRGFIGHVAVIWNPRTRVVFDFFAID